MGKVKESDKHKKSTTSNKDLKKIQKQPDKTKDLKKIRKQLDKTKDENFIDLKKAKLEVLQFGLRGLKGDDKEKGMVDMLVRLGAKPPKNKYLNYKDLLAKKAVEKEKELEFRKSLEQFGGKFLKKKLPKENNKKKIKDLSFGKFKDGVLKVPVGIKSAKKNGMRK